MQCSIQSTCAQIRLDARVSCKNATILFLNFIGGFAAANILELYFCILHVTRIFISANICIICSIYSYLFFAHKLSWRQYTCAMNIRRVHKIKYTTRLKLHGRRLTMWFLHIVAGESFLSSVKKQCVVFFIGFFW